MSNRFIVESLDDWRWDKVNVFDDQDRAEDYAKFLERRRKFTRVRVVVETQRAGRSRRLVTYLGNERPASCGSAQVAQNDGWTSWKAIAGHRVFKDLAYASRVLAGTGMALAVAAALIAGLQLIG